MPVVKTRVWGAQNVHTAPSGSGSTAPRDASAPEAQENGRGPDAAVQVRRCVGGAGPPTVAPPSPGPSTAATRFFPIEDLLEEAGGRDATPVVQDATTDTSSAVDTSSAITGHGWLHRSWTRWLLATLKLEPVSFGSKQGSRPRRIRRLAACGLVLLLVGLEVARRAHSTGQNAPAPHALLDASVASRGASVKPLDGADPPAASSRVARRPTLSKVPEGLERAAVDALAAGDYPRAQQLYEELVASSSEEVFLVAQKILARRAGASSSRAR